jgi:hypothetical protein
MSFLTEAMPLATANEKGPVSLELAVILQHHMLTGTTLDSPIKKHPGQLSVKTPIQQCSRSIERLLVRKIKHHHRFSREKIS